MTTKHEELYSLHAQGDAAYTKMHKEMMKASGMMFGFRRQRRYADELLATYKKLESEFDVMFKEVLLSSHGISQDDIAGRVNTDKFRVLIDRKLHEVKVEKVGKRFVFFLDGIALDEDEKVADVVKNHADA